MKDQYRLDIKKYSFSQRTINKWNKLSTGCVNASSVNIKNKSTLDKQMGVLPCMAILLNLVLISVFNVSSIVFNVPQFNFVSRFVIS